MDGSILRREWGAATFVLTVLIGVVVVPLALFFGHRSGAPVTLGGAPSPTPTIASGARLETPSPSPAVSPSASPAASPAPQATPT